MNHKTTIFRSIIKPLDIIIFLLAVTITIFSIVHLTQNKNESLKVYIDTPNGNYVYDLDTDRDLEFIGPLGTTYVSIHAKEAIFTDSPCPNKTCLYSPPAKKNGDWIACLPNRIFLRVEGKELPENTSSFDAISE
jgi:hypothetical protein